MAHPTKYISETRLKFGRQRAHAKWRGVEWEMTYEEWLRIWEESGFYSKRGNKKGCYCMARHGDLGPYKIGNVSIIPSTQNVSDAYKHKPGKCGRRVSTKHLQQYKCCLRCWERK